MRTIKRLDLFLLQSFLPLFVMTFGICLFIFLMQFLWMYVDEMVGKGIELSVFFELFFYASMKFVPQSLPLAILFASLMTFGNLGEQMELLAMKASGISLVRIMRPLIIFLVFVMVSLFYFQDNVIPVTQVKFYTILWSVKHKSPEMAIPEKIFYDIIPGKNLYVKKKDVKNKLLLDVMIYDYSEGINSVRMIVADSGRIKTSTDKLSLILSLYHGESFENFKNNNDRTKESNEVEPYRRESFDYMEMYIEHDANFNMNSEDMYKDRYIGKNLASLQQSIDSMTVRLDSISDNESRALYYQSYRKTLDRPQRIQDLEIKNDVDDPKITKTVKIDSFYRAQDNRVKASLLEYSKRNIENLQRNYRDKSTSLKFEDKEICRHHMEMHRKFTLSFACMIFFFIGAPLGAIIRKGGLGAPAVLSVFLFIIYYVIDTTGGKFARDAIWLPWQGMWLSSVVLLPLGIFLTYKAVNDSVILNSETYLDTLKRLIGKRECRKIEMKDVIMELPDYDEVGIMLKRLRTSCQQYVTNNKRFLSYLHFWKSGGVDNESNLVSSQLEEVVGALVNSDQIIVLNKVMDFPIISNRDLVSFRKNGKFRIVMAVIFPVGGVIYLIAAYQHKILLQEINTTIKICDEMTNIIDNK